VSGGHQTEALLYTDAGCTGTICGVALSQQLEDFLNFPNLNLLLCGLLADCTNVGFAEGAAGALSEQLTVTLAKPTAASDALIAAGDSTVRLHFLHRSAACIKFTCALANVVCTP